jgi:hypothetical protein
MLAVLGRASKRIDSAASRLWRSHRYLMLLATHIRRHSHLASPVLKAELPLHRAYA